jgi:hypothetical protein
LNVNLRIGICHIQKDFTPTAFLLNF